MSTMSMVQIHSAAIASKAASYHEFILRYSKRAKVVYGFVEGKEDPCFYRGFINSVLPEDWTVELWPAGNKDQVYEIHKLLDWRRFPKRRICFFVDRDLSDIIPEKVKSDCNIYVTSSYSIENDVVSGDICTRVLTEVCGFSGANHTELEEVKELFQKELDIFKRKLIPIMAWVVSWRRSGKRPSLNDILMRDIFAFSNGHIQEIPTPKGKANLDIYIHEQCNIRLDPSIDIAPIVNQIRKGGSYAALARGKYVFWFLIEFCNSTHRDSAALFPTLGKKPKMSTSLSPSNGMAVIGPRAS